MTIRKCTRCDEDKDADEDFYNHKTGCKNRCKACVLLVKRLAYKKKGTGFKGLSKSRQDHLMALINAPRRKPLKEIATTMGISYPTLIRWGLHRDKATTKK